MPAYLISIATSLGNSSLRVKEKGVNAAPLLNAANPRTFMN